MMEKSAVAGTQRSISGAQIKFDHFSLRVVLVTSIHVIRVSRGIGDPNSIPRIGLVCLNRCASRGFPAEQSCTPQVLPGAGPDSRVDSHLTEGLLLGRTEDAASFTYL